MNNDSLDAEPSSSTIVSWTMKSGDKVGGGGGGGYPVCRTPRNSMHMSELEYVRNRVNPGLDPSAMSIEFGWTVQKLLTFSRNSVGKSTIPIWPWINSL